MTVEDLPRLTPRQRRVVELMLTGLSMQQVEAKLGLRRNTVSVIAWQARHRLKTGFVPRQKATKCQRGHDRVPGTRRCKTCDKLARKRRACRPELEMRETRETARARVQREVAQGKRCARCWLLSPCVDHEGSDHVRR